MSQRESMVAPPAGISPQMLARLAELGDSARVGDSRESRSRAAVAGLSAGARPSADRRRARGRQDHPCPRSRARPSPAAFTACSSPATCFPATSSGVTIYNAHSEAFEFKPGPIFSNFLLADEINRTTPKTQSALLEAMNESQVTIDGHSHPLPRPFMVIATQNPVEHHGTYPLPESQLDRFLMRLRIGYPDAGERTRDPAQSASGSFRQPCTSGCVRRGRGRAAGRWSQRVSGGRCAGRLHARHRREHPQPRIAGAGRQPARLAGAVSARCRRWRCSRAASTPFPTTSSGWPLRCSRIAW